MQVRPCEGPAEETVRQAGVTAKGVHHCGQGNVRQRVLLTVTGATKKKGESTTHAGATM